MPPSPLIDPSEIDCSNVLYSKEQIYDFLPQAHEFAQLDGIVHLDTDNKMAVGYRDVSGDEWWCRGHMPGNPIFPGVLMVETVAQLAAFVQHCLYPQDGGGFMGFGGIDKAKFRGSVLPPARIIIAGRATDARMRRFICDAQAFVNGVMVFEGVITGMRIKPE